ITGKWSGVSAGGCPNHPATYPNNPMYQFRVEQDLVALRVELKAPKEVQIGFEILCVEAKNTEAKGYFSKKGSGSYRSGYVVLELENFVAGVYNLIPSTFYAGVEAPYFLNIYAPTALKVNRLK
ncbi:unnamed protein product, partial [Meganyctiphanes norvegica]